MASDRSLASSVAAVMACGLLVVSGCAMAIEGPDPERPRHQVPKCDTGKGAVGMDGVMTTMFGLGSIASFAGGEEGVGLALGAIGGLFLASAIRGNNTADDCRAAFADYNASYQAQTRETIAHDPDLAPRPAVKKKKPAKQPVAETAPPVSPDVQPEATGVDQPQETLAPEYSAPRPPAAKPAKQTEPAKQPAKTTPPPTGDDDWSAFWKEAP